MKIMSVPLARFMNFIWNDYSCKIISLNRNNKSVFLSCGFLYKRRSNEKALRRNRPHHLVTCIFEIDRPVSAIFVWDEGSGWRTGRSAVTAFILKAVQSNQSCRNAVRKVWVSRCTSLYWNRRCTADSEDLTDTIQSAVKSEHSLAACAPRLFPLAMQLLPDNISSLWARLSVTNNY